ncbi:MAG: amidohydrolase [Emcibacter sp.]|nr:amidohydrolase [Emcibacter sp.]
MTGKTGNFKAIDAVVNIWTSEALQHRPDWTDDFFVGKVKGNHSSVGTSLEEMIHMMDEAGIEYAFLIAAKTGRPGLPGCYHMPPEVVAEAVEKYPKRFFGLVGIDPYQGMDGVRALEDDVKNKGFIGAHLYPHWFELAPNHAKYYPFYAKCIELDIPIQMQVGQSLIYAKDNRCRSVGRPIYLDDVACDLPELKLIGSHVGIPWHEEMIAMSWKHENVYICTDAHSPKYWPESVWKYINSYGQDKVIFGTDFPVLGFERTLQEVRSYGLKPAVEKKFLRNNVIKLYGLEARGVELAAED